MTVLAPGARVEIRGVEWVIRRVDATTTGGHSLLAHGVSELVRNREARFLTEIDQNIVVLDPADTELVADESPQYRKTRLYLEALLRQSPPTDDNLYIGHRAAIDVLPFQLDPAIQALEQPRQRILMADGVGLGKTIEVGILLAELMRRGRAKRILVLTSRSMMTQFQKELWSRFTIPLRRLDSAGVQRIRRETPSNVNPFHHYDKVIISIDTLKQESQYRYYIENAWWDVIVIDEAHNVAERGQKIALRSKLAKLLSSRSDTLIMTSATPHDGKATSFASLMNMLNPTAIADPKSYGPADIKGLFLRRFKKDVREQVQAGLKERRISKFKREASVEEERAFDVLENIKFETFDRKRKSGGHLFRTVLEKALFSSPAACRESIEQRLKKLVPNASSEADRDRAGLGELLGAVCAIGPQEFTRYQRLLQALRNPTELDWDGSKTNDRLVIFTERIETLRFLETNLKLDLGLSDKQVATLYAQGSSDKDLQDTVEAFGREKEPVRLLIATDMASEGINLHYLSSKMVHFDVPWSLMVFQQRNGRIDRYGQSERPHISYLVTEPSNAKVRGDLRILELLIEKDEQATTNIGDPSAFFNLYDEELEELETARAMENAETPEEFERRLAKQNEADLLDMLFGDKVPKGEQAASKKRSMPSLFADDGAFLREALTALGDKAPQWEQLADKGLLEIRVNEDLATAFRDMPDEVVRDDKRLFLTTDRAKVKTEIAKCRSEELKWPDVHLLWDLHPIVEWLDYKLLVEFGRKQAPIVSLGSLADGEAYFLVQGEIPNRKGHPAVHAWFAVRFASGGITGILDLPAFLDRSRFASVAANPGTSPRNLLAMQSAVPDVITSARAHMSERRASFNARMKPMLDEHLEKLRLLKTRQFVQLELEFPEDAQLKGRRANRKLQRQREIDRIFSEYETWVAETMTTEDEPFLRIAAVFTGVS